MNEIKVFRIPKRTGTHADVFAAVGLASLLESILEEIRIIERDGEFEIGGNRPVVQKDMERIPHATGYPFLKANDKTKVPAGITDFVDYKAEKAKADRRKLLASSQGKKKRKTVDSETQQMMQQEELREDWRLLQVLNTLQGDETANKIYETIVSRPPAKFRTEMAASLDAIAKQQPSGITWKVSTVQLFTPIAAKGYSRLKPDSTDRNDKTKEQWADPFVEWMKYRGYFRIACPFFQGSKAEHVRLLCPIPHDISSRAFETVSAKLRSAKVFGGPPKLDSLAVLKLADLLIRHSEEYHDSDAEVFPGLVLRDRTPAEAISGIMVTHYQSLGNAKAVSSMFTISVPGWFAIHTKQDSEDWLAILDEHQRVIRGLQDDHSDEIGLLIGYRHFMEKRGEASSWALIEFMERYGAFVMRANGTKLNGRLRWIRRFTAEYFRRILMGANRSLLEIVSDVGFEAVAHAVRESTVRAQNQRARWKANLSKEDTWREIRYELLHDLHRKRKVPGNDFIECVMEFISRYNYENSRRRETAKNPKAAPANVSDEELKAFIALVDNHGSSLVGALLSAYGSCKEKWEPEVAETPESAAGDENQEEKIQ